MLTKTRIASILVVVGAVTAVLTGFQIVDWSAAEGGLVAAEASTVLIMYSALYQHFRPNTKEEPVAVGVALIAFANSTVLLISGFEWVHWSAEQQSLIATLVTVIVALVTGWRVRGDVTAKMTPPST